MNLIGYIKKFGNESFKQRPFSIEDACVLCTAVYGNFEVIAPSIFDEKTKGTKFKDILEVDICIVTAGKRLISKNKELIHALRKSSRFNEIEIKNILKIFKKETSSQFYACTYLIPDVGTFICFRGTDASIIGWREDLLTSVNKVVLSQLDAVDYIHMVTSKEKGPFYVGGHSKGGNLTLYSAINCGKETQDQIVNFFDFDGNGLNYNDYYEKENYLNVKDKIKFLVPIDCVVGEMFYNPKDVLVTKSKSVSVGQHDPNYWKIDKKGGKFVLVPKRYDRSLRMHYIFKFWLGSLDKNDMRYGIDFITDMFGGKDKSLFSNILSFAHVRKLLKKQTKEQKEAMKRISKQFKIAKLQAKIKMIEKDLD